MLTPYKHPWYVALQKQENTTDSDAQSKPKQKQEIPGLTYIKYKDNEELKWAAGLFEGEGSLSYDITSKVWCLKVAMTDLDVLERFAAIWDLKILGPYKKRSCYKDGTPHKDYWHAQIKARDKVFEIVTDIYPDLAERRRAKCDEFIDWYQNKCLS